MMARSQDERRRARRSGPLVESDSIEHVLEELVRPEEAEAEAEAEREPPAAEETELAADEDESGFAGQRTYSYEESAAVAQRLEDEEEYFLSDEDFCFDPDGPVWEKGTLLGVGDGGLAKNDEEQREESNEANGGEQPNPDDEAASSQA